MLQFSPSKINLGLYITDKRADGYHNLESLFLPIAFYDAVELIPADKNDISIYGLNIPGDKTNNSALLSLELMQRQFDIKNYHIHLFKNVAMGAGLGGGSANSAAAINIINQLENLGLNNQNKRQFALDIGSDNAFFIESKAKYVTGRGDILTECDLDLKNFKVVMIIPNFQQSTREAYKNVKFSKPSFDLKEITKESLINKDVKPVNAFEETFLKKFPETKEIIDLLENSGAFYSSLSGTGSAFYGLFQVNQIIPKSLKDFADQQSYRYIETKIL